MNLEERVKRLERQNRFFKLIFLVMLLFIAVAAAQQVVCIPLASESFTLVDSQNKKAAELKVTPDGPVLRMYDGHGKVRFALGIVKFNRDYDPAIGFFNENEDLLGYVRLGRSVPHFSDPDFGTGLGDPRRLK